MMRYTSETVNLISWASVLFALVQLFALLIDLQLHYLQLAHKIMSFWQLDCTILVAYNKRQQIYKKYRQLNEHFTTISLPETHFTPHPCTQQDIWASN